MIRAIFLPGVEGGGVFRSSENGESWGQTHIARNHGIVEVCVCYSEGVLGVTTEIEIAFQVKARYAISYR